MDGQVLSSNSRMLNLMKSLGFRIGHDPEDNAVKRVEIGKLNFLNETAELQVFYDARSLRDLSTGKELSIGGEVYLPAENG